MQLRLKPISIIASLIISLSFIPNAVAKPKAWKDGAESLRNGQIQNPRAIVEVNLELKDDSILMKRVRAAVAYNGAVDYGEDTGYVIRLLNNDGQVLHEKSVNLPRVVFSAPPQNEAEVHTHGNNHAVKNTHQNFVLNFPYVIGVSVVELWNPSGDKVQSLQIKKADGPMPPKFKTIRGNEFLNSSIQFLKNSVTAIFDILIPSAHAEGGYVDIAFISHGYTDLSVYAADIDRFVATMLTYEPYKSRAAKIRFHRIDNTASVGCYYYAPPLDRLLVCDNSIATTIANNAGVPHDKIVVVVNSGSYGGSGGTVAVAYNGYYGPAVFVHEFGHSFAGLKDEYVLYDGGTGTNTTIANCFAGTPPNSAWPTVTAGDYYLGCNYANWYRSSYTSIMRAIDAPYFNAISQNVVNQKIDAVTATTVSPAPAPADTIAPTVVITAPVNGQRITTKNISLKVNATDNVKVVKVEYYLNGKLSATATSGSFSATVNTRKLSGTIAIVAKAYDAANNSASSPVVSVSK